MVDTLHVKWRIWSSDVSSETESGKDLKNLSLYFPQMPVYSAGNIP
jgi:hypothetical protein